MPIENPTHHTCPDCGFMWEHGEHGGHRCAVYLKAKIERLEAGLRMMATDAGITLEHYLSIARPSWLDGGAEAVAMAKEDEAMGVQGLVEALEEIVKQYPNPDISHVDYRVHACRHAEQALAARRAQQGEKP